MLRCVMKRIILLGTVLVSLILLVSCGKSEVRIKDDNKSIHYASLGENVYDDGMIYGSNPLMYLDFKTMESSILCAKPNCNHKGSDCIAKEAGECPIIYNGYLYFFESKQGLEELGDGKREFRINSKLCRISLDSSEKEELVIFTDCVPRDYDGWLIKDNVIWFIGDDMNPIEDEYGAVEYGNAGGTHFICSIDLNTNKYTNYGSVYNDDKKYKAASNSSNAQLKGFYDSKLMIRYEFAKDYTPTQIDENFDYRDYLTELMFTFDTDTKALESTELYQPSYVDEDTYVYSEYKQGKTHVIDKNKEYILDCDADLNAKVFNNKLFVDNPNEWYNLNDNSRHSLGEYSDYDIAAYYDNCYILNKNNTEFIKLTEKELLALDKE